MALATDIMIADGHQDNTGVGGRGGGLEANRPVVRCEFEKLKGSKAVGANSTQ